MKLPLHLPDHEFVQQNHESISLLHLKHHDKSEAELALALRHAQRFGAGHSTPERIIEAASMLIGAGVTGECRSRKSIQGRPRHPRPGRS